MVARLRIKFKNKNEIVAKLGRLAPEMLKAAEKGSETGAEILVNGFRMAAPVRTGNYRSKFTIKVIPKGTTPTGSYFKRKSPLQHDVFGVYGSPLWHIIEFGRRAGGRTGASSPRPHIFPMWRANRPRIKRQFTRNFSKVLRNGKFT